MLNSELSAEQARSVIAPMTRRNAAHMDGHTASSRETLIGVYSRLARENLAHAERDTENRVTFLLYAQLAAHRLAQLERTC